MLCKIVSIHDLLVTKKEYELRAKGKSRLKTKTSMTMIDRLLQKTNQHEIIASVEDAVLYFLGSCSQLF